jgi:hypothetical protein
MRAAERGPVYQILSKFSDIHGDRDTRAKFEVFRHVVFDYLDTYYIAVPLEAPRYRLAERTELVRTRLGQTREVIRTWREPVDEAEREALRDEAHLLANLFASFEREGIFHRIDSRFLGKLTRTEPTVEAARARLRRQGSKFAESTAFRLYRFRDGAWPEIILGAVMGAARRVEAAKQRQRLEDLVAGATLDGAPVAAETTGRPQPAPEPRREAEPASPADGTDDERVAAFGRYARFVPPEGTAPARGRFDDGRPANNNTSPDARPSRTPERAAANVVAIPRPQPLRPSSGETASLAPAGGGLAAAVARADWPDPMTSLAETDADTAANDDVAGSVTTVIAAALVVPEPDATPDVDPETAVQAPAPTALRADTMSTDDNRGA